MTRLFTILIAALLAGCSSVLLPPNVTPIVPTPLSVAQADQTLVRVTRERAETEARYAASEQLCYAKFFVNNCLDKAKEARRGKLAYLNAVENENQYYKRKMAVEERDRALAQAQKDFDAEEARRAAEPASAPAAVPPLPPARATLAGRQAAHAAKQARQAAAERAKAAQAPRNVADFEKKKADALERQRQVAEKQAATAKKQAEKAAQDAKDAQDAQRAADAAKAAQPAPVK